MKTVMKLVLSALLAFALVSPAAAYFEPGNLVMVAYDKVNNLEVAVDIADYGTDFSAQNVQLVADGTLDMSQFNLDTTFLSYYTWYNNEFTAYYGTSTPDSSSFNPNGLGSSYFGGDALNAEYKANSGGTRVFTGLANDLNSFTTKFDGYYAGMLTSTSDGQARLADINTEGYVDMYLFKAEAATQATTQIAELRLTSAGGVVLNPVPVPAAVWMLASGLVGLVGVRRKK